MDKLLVVTADDYGLHPDFDEGTLACAEAGSVNAVSVMTERGALRGVERLKASGARIGLHLDYGRPADWGKISAREKTARFKKQLEAFRKAFGFEPEHFDGHHHCHSLDQTARELVSREAKNRGVYVRSKAGEFKPLETNDWFLNPDEHGGVLGALAACKPGVNELMVHPGFVREGTDYSFTTRVAKRAGELSELLGAGFGRALAGNKLELARFNR